MSRDLPQRGLLIGLSAFAGISSLGGAIELLWWRDGNAFVPIGLLENTPFESFLIPGLVLGLLIALPNLACAIFAWRRSRAAIDAAILAGGALTAWILAEAAIMRGVHWLHLIYGTLGAAILALGLSAGWSSQVGRHRWVISVTLAEAAGFLVPGVVGIVAYRSGATPGAQFALVIAAGAVEGLVLGSGQAFAFALPVRRLRYALWTAAGAAGVWAMVMALMSWGESAQRSPPALLALMPIAALLGLAAIGSAQWIELRHHAARAYRWIGWTALAWAIALPLSFTASPFVDESTPLVAHLVLWFSAGLLMAYVMAVITWQGVRRLIPSGGA